MFDLKEKVKTVTFQFLVRVAQYSIRKTVNWELFIHARLLFVEKNVVRGDRNIDYVKGQKK
jgi:hypothetical protein